MLMGVIDRGCVATMCIVLLVIIAIHSGQAHWPATGRVHIQTGTRRIMATGHRSRHLHGHRASRLHPDTRHIHWDMSIPYTLLETRLRRVKNSNKRCGKIDIGGCFFLDLLDHVTLATGDDVMEFVVNVTGFGMKTTLNINQQRRKKATKNAIPSHPTSPTSRFSLPQRSPLNR